jgi:hypothetical protein
MNAQAAVNCAKHAGFDMWYDHHTRLWVIQELDDPLCNKPAQYIASRPLRGITRDLFHERYLVKTVTP